MGDEATVITRAAIRDLGREIARAFLPHKVILFGSHARGGATADSDVDLLVILPCAGDEVRKAAEIRLSINPPFPVDILVRTPECVHERLRLGDGFVREVLETGQVLYEAPDR